MSQKLEELPLFPLNTVLFPYASVQLHVYEEHYKAMIDDCLEYDHGFGTVLLREGAEGGALTEPCLVGTAVRISEINRQENGEMDMVIQGQRRFRIRKLNESGPVLMGLVEPIVEMEIEDNPRTDALVMKVKESFSILVEAALARPNYTVQIQLPTDPTMLSFAIASLLPMENQIKQNLLETTDTLERIRMLINLIEEHIQQAQPSQTYRLTSEHLSDWISPN